MLRGWERAPQAESMGGDGRSAAVMSGLAAGLFMWGRMVGMVTTGFCLLWAVAVALLAGIAIRPRAIGWFVVGLGLLFLTHAGVNMAIIWAHNNEVPPYVNFYLL